VVLFEELDREDRGQASEDVEGERPKLRPEGEPSEGDLTVRLKTLGASSGRLITKQFDSTPILLDSCVIPVSQRRNSPPVAVVMEIGELYAPTDGTASSTEQKRVVGLAHAASDRIDRHQDMLWKALGP
jgi:hypothetical protein